MSMHVGQSAVDAVVAPGEPSVIDAEKFQHGGVDVVDECRVIPIQWLVTPLVAFAVRDPAFDSTAAEPIGEDIWIVVAAGSAL